MTRRILAPPSAAAAIVTAAITRAKFAPRATIAAAARYIPHDPHPKQREFLELDAREAFYGGAAGGGKSDALLMAALQYVDVPGYAALLLRKSYADLVLPGALLTRAHEWLAGTDARWDDRAHAYRFPAGSSLTFGYLERDDDRFRYKGAELQFIGIDELTQHNELPYRYLFSRQRRLEGSNVPVRMRATSNPGDRGHDWVKARFIDPGDPTRPFIPASLADNPSLDREDYERSLAELDPVTRAQLLNGDWSARTLGGKFRREWYDVVDAAPAELDRVVRYWDMAATEAKRGADPDWSAGVKMARTGAGLYYVLDVKRIRAKPLDVQRLIAQTAVIDSTAVAVRMEQEPGSSGKTMIDHYRRNVLPAYDFRGVPSTGAKEIRANPFSSQSHAGNVKLVRGAWIGDYLDELDAFGSGAGHDDQVDASSGAFTDLHIERLWGAA